MCTVFAVSAMFVSSPAPLPRPLPVCCSHIQCLPSPLHISPLTLSPFCLSLSVGMTAFWLLLTSFPNLLLWFPLLLKCLLLTLPASSLIMLSASMGCLRKLCVIGTPGLLLCFGRLYFACLMSSWIFPLLSILRQMASLNGSTVVSSRYCDVIVGLARILGTCCCSRLLLLWTILFMLALGSLLLSAFLGLTLIRPFRLLCLVCRITRYSLCLTLFSSAMPFTSWLLSSWPSTTSKWRHPPIASGVTCPLLWVILFIFPLPTWSFLRACPGSSLRGGLAPIRLLHVWELSRTVWPFPLTLAPSILFSMFLCWSLMRALLPTHVLHFLSLIASQVSLRLSALLGAVCGAIDQSIWSAGRGTPLSMILGSLLPVWAMPGRLLLILRPLGLTLGVLGLFDPPLPAFSVLRLIFILHLSSCLGFYSYRRSLLYWGFAYLIMVLLLPTIMSLWFPCVSSGCSLHVWSHAIFWEGGSC